MTALIKTSFGDIKVTIPLFLLFYHIPNNLMERAEENKVKQTWESKEKWKDRTIPEEEQLTSHMSFRQYFPVPEKHPPTHVSS
jgi:hypothetical protein